MKRPENLKLWLLEWFSTGLLCIASMLTVLDFYPWNVAFSFAGNFGWMIAGFIAENAALWFVSLFILIIYIGGLIYKFL